MMIIDQHAAHERLKYEELKKDIASKQVVSQMLIEPVIVNLTGSEMTAYRDNKQLFDDIGFESEEFGDDAVIVRSVPGEVELGEVEPLVLETCRTRRGNEERTYNGKERKTFIYDCV